MKLPIGLSDFREIIKGGFEFVDKTLFIQDILNDTNVILITRPRRFGKTLNLSMLKYFFAKEENGQSNKALFKGLKIAQLDPEVLEHQEKYPVIFISFKDIKSTNFINTYNSFCRMIKDLYAEHRYLLSSSTLYDDEREVYETILTQQATQVNIEASIKDLTKYLFRHYGVNPIILIDEYDTPIQQGYMYGYYNEIVGFSRILLGTALKDNPYLSKAILTGILRISKESLFSDVNNIEIYPLTRREYSAYFGFTEQETLDLLSRSTLLRQAEEIKDWYNGYQIGNTVIYNPWSIINCIKQKGELQPYWVNTSDNTLIKDLLIHSSAEFKMQFELLLQGIHIETVIDDHMVFQYLNSNEIAIWTLFLMAGYLRIVKQRRTDQGLFCTVAIPNREVRNLYRRIIETWLSDGRALNWYNQFINDLLIGDVPRMQTYLSEILLQTVSVYDMAKEPEAFYHGLMLGLTASISNEYEIKSNREAGFGFFDIVIIPKNTNKLGIVIELKISKAGQIEKTAALALKQITDRQYSMELKARGIQDILNIGIAFEGKEICIAHQRET